MDAFQVLGIAPTKDKKEIKKAYARLAKLHHPEEEPEKWQEIHDAYGDALKLAEKIDKLQKNDVPVSNVHEQHMESENYHSSYDNELIKKAEEEKELEGLAAISRARELAQRVTHLKKVVEELDSLLEKDEQRYDEWEEFFATEEYQWAFRQKQFLYNWGKGLKGKQIDRKLHQLMSVQLEDVIQYHASAYQDDTVSEFAEMEAYTKKRIDDAYYKRTNMIFMFFAVIIAVGCWVIWDKPEIVPDFIMNFILLPIAAIVTVASFGAIIYVIISSFKQLIVSILNFLKKLIKQDKDK